MRLYHIRLTTKNLAIGGTEIIDCKNAVRAAIGDPLIADVAILSTDEILVNGKAPGSTVLYIWDAFGRRLFNVVVTAPTMDIPALGVKIEKEINDPRITVRCVDNSIMLEGTVTKPSQSEKASAIAQAIMDSASSHCGSPAGAPGSASGTSAAYNPKLVNLLQIQKAIDEVSSTTTQTAVAIRNALKDSTLAITALPGSVVMVEGNVGTPDELAQICLILKGWSKEGKDAGAEMSEKITIVNAVKVNSSIARQVMVQTEVIDVDTDSTKNLGLEYGRTIFSSSTVAGIERAATVDEQPFMFGPRGNSTYDTISGGSNIGLYDTIGAKLRALQQDNKAKILSKPNLLVLDGQEANILVGGEIPIPIVQSTPAGGAGAITITYKEFGVRLHIAPVITSQETIQLRILTEVSSVSFANAIIINGFNVPSLQTRRAETIVNVQNGQSLAIGGLMQNGSGKTVKRIPFLSDIPIIGEFFKSKTWTKNETELVIILTPQIVKPTASITVK